MPPPPPVRFKLLCLTYYALALSLLGGCELAGSFGLISYGAWFVLGCGLDAGKDGGHICNHHHHYISPVAPVAEHEAAYLSWSRPLTLCCRCRRKHHPTGYLSGHVRHVRHVRHLELSPRSLDQADIM